MGLLDSLKSMMGGKAGAKGETPADAERPTFRKRTDVRKRFEVLKESSAGTMSSFFKARDRENGQIVGVKVLDKVRADLDAVAKVESQPRMEGRQMIMVISPK